MNMFLELGKGGVLKLGEIVVFQNDCVTYSSGLAQQTGRTYR